MYAIFESVISTQFSNVHVFYICTYYEIARIRLKDNSLLINSKIYTRAQMYIIYSTLNVTDEILRMLKIER